MANVMHFDTKNFQNEVLGSDTNVDVRMAATRALGQFDDPMARRDDRVFGEMAIDPLEYENHGGFEDREGAHPPVRG